MEKTQISWTDATWNPVTGCSKVSEGCRNCYAYAIAAEWPALYNGFKVTPKPHKLAEPLRWSGRRIFLGSMMDLFHPDIPLAYLLAVWGIMLYTPQHTYQILTKRPEVAKERLSSLGLVLAPNIWLGVSIENQRCADLRLPILERIPAAIRFVSAEPLLGPVALGTARDWLEWVIVGGESGPNRREMDLTWATALRDECLDAGIAYYYKQGNGFRQGSQPLLEGQTWHQAPPQNST